METRANYIVTGAFTLAVIVGVFGFIFWFQNTAGGGERSSYRVEFVGSVSGLRTGSAVLFNGIRVGRVSGLGLARVHRIARTAAAADPDCFAPTSCA